MAAALIFTLLLGLTAGSVFISPWHVLQILTGSAEPSAYNDIVLLFRLPRILTAVFAGAALALAGLLMQTLFQNPLAGPDVLGITAGASLGVAIFTLVGGAAIAGLGLNAVGFTTVGFAVAGSAVAFLAVLAASSRLRGNLTLLILGLMVASIVAALVSALQFFATADETRAFMLWTFGSVGGVTWARLWVLLPTVCLGLAAAALLAKPLNLLLLGEAYAASLGLQVARMRMGILVVTSLLTGAVTAFCGPIAFIGIAVPHIARRLLPTTDHRYLLPLSALTGAFTLAVCDLIAQLPGTSLSLPINVVTSLVGAPVVIVVVLRRSGLWGSFSTGGNTR